MTLTHVTCVCFVYPSNELVAAASTDAIVNIARSPGGIVRTCFCCSMIGKMFVFCCDLDMQSHSAETKCLLLCLGYCLSNK